MGVEEQGAGLLSRAGRQRWRWSPENLSGFPGVTGGAGDCGHSVTSF